MRFDYEVTSIDDLPHAFKWASELLRMGLPGGPMALYVDRPKRSLEQNSKLWPMLEDISKQVVWHGSKLTPYEWKDVFTAAIKRQKLVPGIDGGLVVIGGHTSKMSRRDFSEMIEFMYAFGTERNVIWSEPAEVAILDEHRKRLK